ERVACRMWRWFWARWGCRTPQNGGEATGVKAAPPAIKIALASLRPYAVMPGGLILWVLIASHQNSTISRWQGSVTAGSNFAATSLSLLRSNSGLRMSQLFAHMVHHKLNHVLFMLIRPTYPHLTLPSFCSRWLTETSWANVVGTSSGLTRSAR